MGNRDIQRGLDCTNHFLKAKITMNVKPTCTELRAVNATQSYQALCIKLDTIGLTEHSRRRRCSHGWQLG